MSRITPRSTCSAYPRNKVQSGASAGAGRVAVVGERIPRDAGKDPKGTEQKGWAEDRRERRARGFEGSTPVGVGVSGWRPTAGPFLTTLHKTATPARTPLPTQPSPGPPQTHLLLELGGGHLLEVLQVGVEEPTAHERHPQQGLHDVADGAVVRQPDPLSCAHEVAPAAGGEGQHMS